MAKLTARQQTFVEEYLVDLNATQAAIRAGYSEKTARSVGSENLTKPDIAAAIQAAQQVKADEMGITQQYILDNLKEVVERCMQRAPVMVRRGNRMEQLEDEDGNDVWQFNAKGAVSALTLLGKHRGMFAEKHEHSGANGSPIKFTLNIGAANVTGADE
jgi:phage terminase small subunit